MPSLQTPKFLLVCFSAPQLPAHHSVCPWLVHLLQSSTWRHCPENESFQVHQRYLLKNSFICSFCLFSSPPARGVCNYSSYKPASPFVSWVQLLPFPDQFIWGKFLSFWVAFEESSLPDCSSWLFKFRISSVLLSLQIRLCLLVTCNILLSVTILRTDGDWRWFGLIIWVILILSSGMRVCALSMMSWAPTPPRVMGTCVNTFLFPIRANFFQYLFLILQSISELINNIAGKCTFVRNVISKSSKTWYVFCNWRIIALQNFVVFCQTATWINHRYTYIPSVLKKLGVFVSGF